MHVPRTALQPLAYVYFKIALPLFNTKFKSDPIRLVENKILIF
jgi:hypothetical protein